MWPRVELAFKRIQDMASTYQRIALLAIACLTATQATAQDATSGYSRYGQYGPTVMPTVQDAPAYYPQTTNATPNNRTVESSGYPAVEITFPQSGTAAPSPMRTPSTSGPATHHTSDYTPSPSPSYRAGGSAAAYYQAPNSPYGYSYQQPTVTQAPAIQSSVVIPQYASVGGGVGDAYPSNLGQTLGSPVPIPAEPYISSSYGGDMIGGCDDYGCGTPTSKFFATYDYLVWTISPPKTSLIGSTQLEGDYNRGGVTTHFENSLDTSFMDWKFQSGHRVEFGCRDCYSGWLVGYSYGRQNLGLSSTSVNFLPAEPGFPLLSNSYLAGYSDGNGDGIDDDLNLNDFYGRFGEDIGTPDGMGGFALPTDGTPDVPAPTDTGDLQIYLPVFDEATVRNTVTMSNLEVMYMTRMNRMPGNNFEFLYGVRYLDLEDAFAFSGTGGVLDATSFSVKSENQLLGFQVGARWQKCIGPCYLNAEGRFLAAANMQDNKMQGTIASNIQTNSNGQNGPINLNPQAFNYVSSDNVWSPLGELRLQAIFPINDCAAFRLGYTGFVVDGISRASQKVDYVLPRFGLNQSASNETIVFSSFNIGFEFNR